MVMCMDVETRTMHSRNFEFLRSHHRELSDLGGFAEHYAHSDPASALVKLRLFGENLVADFLQHHKVPRLPQSTFLELLQIVEDQNPAFCRSEQTPHTAHPGQPRCARQS